MSDSCIDLEKGIATGLKEEEKGISTELKEEEKAVHHQFKHLKVVLHVYPALLHVAVMLVFLGMTTFMGVYIYRQTHIWFPLLAVASMAICSIGICCRLKRTYINTLPSADGDLSTALLASSKK